LEGDGAEEHLPETGLDYFRRGLFI
jgi:hypothetical protein